jgi:hypothetical protein
MSTDQRPWQQYDPRLFCPPWCIDAHMVDVRHGGLSTCDGCEHESLPLLDFHVTIEGTTALAAKDQTIVLYRSSWTEHPEGPKPDEGWTGYRLSASDGTGTLGASISRADLRRLAVQLLEIAVDDKEDGR